MQAGQGHILIVDDNELNRRILTRALRQQGYTTAASENGHQALELLRSEQKDGYPLFDVVLLDILMPVMDGYEALAVIKNDSTLQHIPVIMISALDEMGATDYLPKPFNQALLNARISASLANKRLRDLEKAYLQQEVMLRQEEKIASLGRLSAGMAHELNNPASAALRSANQLQEACERLKRACLDLAGKKPSPEHLAMLTGLDPVVRDRVKQPVGSDLLTPADLESELETWLELHDVGNPWELTASLLNLGFKVGELEEWAAKSSGGLLPPMLAWLDASFTIYRLIQEITQGARRISDIIQAFKGYTYLDQAPFQTVGIHGSLENTLHIVTGGHEGRIRLRREYAQDLPGVQANGRELSQVWTHLIDNAVDALNGEGQITLRTRREDAGIHRPGHQPRRDPVGEHISVLPRDGRRGDTADLYGLVGSQPGHLRRHPALQVLPLHVPAAAPAASVPVRSGLGKVHQFQRCHSLVASVLFCRAGDRRSPSRPNRRPRVSLILMRRWISRS